MWVVVNKNGDEGACAVKPNRACYAPIWGGVDPANGDYRDVIVLPTGAIERLLGRKLTWEDDPVEITKLKNN